MLPLTSCWEPQRRPAKRPWLLKGCGLLRKPASSWWFKAAVLSLIRAFCVVKVKGEKGAGAGSPQVEAAEAAVLQNVLQVDTNPVHIDRSGWDTKGLTVRCWHCFCSSKSLPPECPPPSSGFEHTSWGSCWLLVPLGPEGFRELCL